MGLDQAPIVVMVENYRTGLIWKMFMSNPGDPAHAGQDRIPAGSAREGSRPNSIASCESSPHSMYTTTFTR
jgi:hypothetical protein